MNIDASGTKVSSVMNAGRRGAWRKYRELFYGDMPYAKVLWAELAVMAFSAAGGGLGILLRSRAYRPLFGETGGNTVIGRYCTFRHYAKIRLGKSVILDDNCLIDAKGGGNQGIRIGDDVYVGRNSSIYCKNGDIDIGSRVNISSSCTIMSANRITIGEDTVIGAYSYLLSGGEYDYASGIPYSKQTGMNSCGPLSIGKNCWIGARVTVLDAASIGDGCVIGAGSVVTRPIPDRHLAVGTPAKIVKPVAARTEVGSNDSGKPGLN